MVAREVARADQWACVCDSVCVCSVSQSHASLSDNGIAGPHRGWVVAPSRDPIMPVPLRVATWKRGPTVITAWPSGGEDTLSVSPRRNAWMSLSCLPACPPPLFFFILSPINPPSRTTTPSISFQTPPHTLLPLLFLSCKSAPPSWEKQHAPVRYEDQNQEENKRIPVDLLRRSILVSGFFESTPWQRARFALMTLSGDCNPCLLVYGTLSVSRVFIENTVLCVAIIQTPANYKIRDLCLGACGVSPISEQIFEYQRSLLQQVYDCVESVAIHAEDAGTCRMQEINF